jgi:hypothetical protein
MLPTLFVRNGTALRRVLGIGILLGACLVPLACTPDSPGLPVEPPGGPEPKPPAGPGPSAPPLLLDSVAAWWNLDSLVLSGRTDANATVRVAGGLEPASEVASASGTFAVTVRLQPNAVNSLTAVATGGGGRESAPVTRTVRHDDIAPEAPALDSLPRFTRLTSVQLAGRAEPLSTVTLETPQGTQQVPADTAGRFAVTVSLQRNSPNVLRVRATDRASNQGAVASTIVTHDDVPPVAPSLDPLPQFAGSASLEVTGATEPGASVVAATSAGSAQAVADAAGGFRIVVPLAANALNTISAHATDRAGNQGAPRQAMVQHDGVPPTFTLVSPTRGATVPAPPAAFQIVAEYRDSIGAIDQQGIRVVADRPLRGMLQQDGTIAAELPAGSNLAAHAIVTASQATYFVAPGYVFPGGPVRLVGSVSDHAGNTSRPDTVSFTATDPPNQVITIHSAAARGARGHLVPIGLINPETLGGIGFTLTFDPSRMRVDSIRATERVSFAVTENSATQGTSGAVKVALFDVGGRPIAAGQGIVLHAYVSIASSAAAGSSLLVAFTDPVASTPAGTRRPLITIPGWIRIN